MASAAMLCRTQEYGGAEAALKKAMETIVNASKKKRSTPEPETEPEPEPEPQEEEEEEEISNKQEFVCIGGWMEKGSRIHYGSRDLILVQLMGHYKGKELEAIRPKYDVPENITNAWVWAVSTAEPI